MEDHPSDQVEASAAAAGSSPARVSQQRLAANGDMSVAVIVAELAHELSQPLGAIANYAQAGIRMVRRDAVKHGRDLAETMDRIAEQASRAAEMVGRLRHFAANAKPAFAPFDVNDAIRSAAGLLHSEALAARVDVCFELAEGLPRAWADRIQMEQVLVNLIRNAIEAMQDVPEARRRLEVRSSLGEDCEIHVAVSDTGEGLPADEPERVFARVFTTKLQGMGLGLPISRSIVANCGGRLWATPGPACGTTFHFTIPAKREEGASWSTVSRPSS